MLTSNTSTPPLVGATDGVKSATAERDIEALGNWPEELPTLGKRTRLALIREIIEGLFLLTPVVFLGKCAMHNCSV